MLLNVFVMTVPFVVVVVFFKDIVISDFMFTTFTVDLGLP